MKRKINQVGNGTLTVSLPSSWVKEKNIQKGDELNITENAGSLILDVGTTRLIEDEVDVIYNKQGRLTSRQLFNLYRRGVTKIRLHYKDSKAIKDIQIWLSGMMGFEIINQKENLLELSSIMKVEEEKFDNTMRRFFLVTLNMADEVYNAFSNKKFDQLEGISELEKLQNRYYMYCARSINVLGTRLFKTPSVAFLLVQRLEDIADDYKYICNYYVESKINTISDSTLDYMKEINYVLRLVYTLYYKFEIKTLDEINIRKKELIKKGFKLLEQSKKNELRTINILNNLIVKIYEAASPIVGLQL